MPSHAYVPIEVGMPLTEVQRIVDVVTTIVVGSKENVLPERNTQVVLLLANNGWLLQVHNMLQDLLEVDPEPSILVVVPHVHEVHVRTTKGIDKVYEVHVATVIEETKRVFVAFANFVDMVQMAVRIAPTILLIDQHLTFRLDRYAVQNLEIKMLSKEK